MLAKLRAMKEDEGFTLVELLVVISILGVLAGIVVFSISGVQDSSHSAACSSDKAILQTAQEAYFAKNGAFAADVTALSAAGFLGSGTTSTTYWDTTGTPTGGPYTGYTMTKVDTTCA